MGGEKVPLSEVELVALLTYCSRMLHIIWTLFPHLQGCLVEYINKACLPEREVLGLIACALVLLLLKAKQLGGGGSWLLE